MGLEAGFHLDRERQFVQVPVMEASMAGNGMKFCNGRQIVWCARFQGWQSSVNKGANAWLMFMGVAFFAWTAFCASLDLRAALPARFLHDLALFFPFLAISLLLILGSLCGFFWINELDFDLRERRYLWRRGVGRWAKTVAAGDFTDFSHIEVKSGQDSETGPYSLMTLV